MTEKNPAEFHCSAEKSCIGMWQIIFDYLSRSLDIYSALYDKFVLTGDFNAEESEDILASFLNCHNASNLVSDKTSVPNPEYIWGYCLLVLL